MFKSSKIQRLIPHILPLAVFNLIVIFNINPLYIGTIYSFVFLLFYPGVLISRLLHLNQNLPRSEIVIYSAALSIAYLIFSGLLTNWTLPVFGISDPLSLMPLLLSQDVFLVALLLAASRLEEPSEHRMPLKIEMLRSLYLYIFPLFIPALSVIGALSLNNGGDNYFTMVMWALSAATMVCAALFRKRISYIYYAYLLFVFGAAFLLAMSLRGWTIIGHDILPEFFVFQLTKSHSLWNIANYRDAYNACLSITLLPTLFSRFLLIPDQYVFRIAIQIIFSLALPALFLFIRRYTTDFYAFMACIFFIAQSPFLRDFPYMIRQELAIFFYIFTLLSLFNIKLPAKLRSVLFLFFGFSMIVSHYSTTYVAITLFIAMYILSLGFRANTKIREYLSSRIQRDSDSEAQYLRRGGRTVILVLFAFLWYSQLTATGNDLFTFLVKNVQNMSSLWRQDLHSQVFIDQFSIFMKPIDTKELLNQYIRDVNTNTTALTFVSTFSPETYATYTPYLESDVFLPYKMNKSVAVLIFSIGELFKKGMKIFILTGILYLWHLSARQKMIQREFIHLLSANFLLLCVALLFLIMALGYDVNRVYQQNLVILSLAAILGCLQFLRIVRDRFRPTALSAVFIIYFLFVSGFVSQIIGGTHAYLQTNNFGSYYDLYYSHATEIESIQWLKSNKLPEDPVYSDWYTKRKIYYADVSIPEWTYGTVLPSAVDKDSYVYAGFTNTRRHAAYTFFKGHELMYNFPLEFFDNNKDLIYDNGDSRIYK